MNEVTTIIKKYREERLMSMQDLADALTAGCETRVSVQSIHQWESGKNKPNKFIWVKLALQTFDWRRDMACEVLKAMDPNFSTELCAMLMGAEH